MSLHHHHHHEPATSDHHHHDHAPGHHHIDVDVSSMTKAFAIGIVLNLGFVIIETGFGFWTNSLALLADASHNFGDVIGLVLAWGASALMQRKPSAHFTYGLGSSTILAALANALLLLIAVSGIVWVATERLIGAAQPEINQNIVIWVAAVGIVINTATAMLFHSRQKHDLNARAAFLHMAADAGVSLGVVIAAFITRSTHWNWLDPIVSLVIAGVIFGGTWGLFRQSLKLALHAVPEGVTVDAVKTYLGALRGVATIHDLHIWAMSTTENALTAHLVMPHGHPGDRFIAETANEIERRFRIGHVTLQIETGSDQSGSTMPCKQAQGHCA